MPRDSHEVVIGDRMLALRSGDITKIPADAIGNAANAALRGGGGVDGAIHRAGGPAIMHELNAIRQRIGKCAPGDAVATGAGNLPARWILHAVGPIYHDGTHGEAETLASCFRRCMELADTLGAESLTLPAISTGVYGYPLDAAADIAVRTVTGILRDSETQLSRVTFVLFGNESFHTFRRASSCVLGSTARRGDAREMPTWS